MAFYCDECERKIESDEVIEVHATERGFHPSGTTTRMPDSNPRPTIPQNAHVLHAVTDTVAIDREDPSIKTKRARAWYHIARSGD